MREGEGAVQGVEAVEEYVYITHSSNIIMIIIIVVVGIIVVIIVNSS